RRTPAMTCLPTAASPPVIECTRPTLMTSCAHAPLRAPSSTAIAIAVTRNDLCMSFLPWTDPWTRGGGPVGAADGRCLTHARAKDRIDAVDFQRLLAARAKHDCAPTRLPRLEGAPCAQFLGQLPRRRRLRVAGVGCPGRLDQQ